VESPSSCPKTAGTLPTIRTSPRMNRAQLLCLITSLSHPRERSPRCWRATAAPLSVVRSRAFGCPRRRAGDPAPLRLPSFRPAALSVEFRSGLDPLQGQFEIGLRGTARRVDHEGEAELLERLGVASLLEEKTPRLKLEPKTRSSTPTPAPPPTVPPLPRTHRGSGIPSRGL
jgi:hypothetical protein